MRQRAEKTASIFLDTLRSKANIGEPTYERRYKRSKSAPNGLEAPKESDENVIEVIKDTAWDGIKYLGSEHRSTRIMWMSIMITFLCIAIYQIMQQVYQYQKNPIATNVDIDYPKTINYPVVAICNNNRFRLSYITSLHSKLKSTGRRRRETPLDLKGLLEHSKNPLDQVLVNHADDNAVEFLNNASHQIEGMLVKCVLPNGTFCKPADFYPLWTMEGLCWAMNFDWHKPISVNGAGPFYGLQLLLNVESYERIKSPHLFFHSTALPGFKILVFNQTDLPVSISNGLNVPPGFTTYLPLQVQELSKLESTGCVEETSESKFALEHDYFSASNVRGCKAHRLSQRVEDECNCSMRALHAGYLGKAYALQHTMLPICTISRFFGCARNIIVEVSESGSLSDCPPPCETIEFVGHQDLNRLPEGLMPTEKEDVLTDVELMRIRRDSSEIMHLTTTTTTTSPATVLDELGIDVELNSPRKPRPNIYDTLEMEQADQIKAKATIAYEAQQKYQVDIAERFHRLITNVHNAKLRLFAAKWGWTPRAFTGVYQRLTEKHSCIKAITNGYKDIVMYLALPSNRPEEYRAQLLLKIVDPETHKIDPTRYKSLAQVRNAYGDKIEPQRQELILILRMSKELWTAFNEDVGKLENFASVKEWAEEMNSPDKQFFVNEEFQLGWYKTIFENLDTKLVKTLRNVMKNHWPKHKNYTEHSKTYLRTASILFLSGLDSEQNKTYVKSFYDDMESCMKEVNETGVQLLTEFKTLYKKWKSAYKALFEKELNKVLDKFEFTDDFERENLALVNIYINKMAVEKWTQEPSYSVWSLLSDVGGSLGLFLGASLISLMELLYIFFFFGGKKVEKTVIEVKRKRSMAPTEIQAQAMHPKITIDPKGVV